jgi:predicted PurR-regulated permease PerM
MAPSLRARALSTLGGVHRVGIFVGPVVLAVAYMLLESWMDEVPHDP